MHTVCVCACMHAYSVCANVFVFIVDRATPFATPAGHHFASCLKRYGSPIVCFDLVKVNQMYIITLINAHFILAV